MSTIRMDRRTFLKAMGVSGTALLGAGRLLGSAGTGTAAAADTSSDAILELGLSLDFDVERMFRFVSEEIRYEPYAGILRGAHGTLMARAGNSADQAALLAALLQVSGVPYRFATAAISSADAQDLLASAITDVDTARHQVHEAFTGQGEGGRPITIKDPDPAVLERVREAAAKADDMIAWSKTRLHETVEQIVGTLDSAGIALPGGFTPMPPLEQEQHVWVQVASGPEWTDLDPSRPNSVMGDAVGAPSVVHDTLPDELRHLVRFEVFNETVSGGQLLEESLTSVEEFADVLVGRPVAVFNTERSGLRAVGVEIAAALQGATEYVPCVVLGEEVVIGTKGVRFAGDPSDDPFAVPGEPLSGVPDGESVAEWIVATISSPGSEPTVVRRAIFDRLGPAAREGGSPEVAALTPVPLVQVEDGAPVDFLPAQRTHWLTVHTGIVGGRTLAESLLDTRIDSLLANVVQAYHLVREASGVEVAVPAGVRSFIDAPNVVSYTIDQELGEDSALMLRPSVDIWHRSFGVTPVGSIGAAGPAPLIANVMSHIAERSLAGDALQSDAGMRSASVGTVFEQARAEGIGLRAVTSAIEVDDMPYMDDARARLRLSITGGRVAVVPERPVVIRGAERVGWWLIDPASGHVADQMDDGGGASAVGYVRVSKGMLEASINIRRLAVCVGLIALVGAGILEVYGGIYLAATGGGGLGSGLGAAIAAAGAGTAGTSSMAALSYGCQ